MQHSHDQNLIETSSLQAKLRALEQGSDKTSTNKLSEENKILQESLNLKVSETMRLNDKLKQSEKELSKSVSTIQASEAAKKSVESKISVYEDKIRKLEAAQKEVDSMTNKKIEEVNHELRKTEAKNTSLSSDLQKASGALNVTQEEVKTLKAKLQELEAHLTRADSGKETETRLHEVEQKRSDLEGNVKNLEKQLTVLSHKLVESETETNRLLQENRTLTDENKTISERLQTTPASNGDIHENGPSVSLADHENIVSGKEKEVKELAAGLETQKKTLLNIQGQLDAKVAEVANIREELNQQRQKNNDLRSKNWKAMEALELSEKSATEKVDKALKSARELSSTKVTEVEAYDKTIFQRLFPDVQVSDKLAHKEWVTMFEKQALKKTSDKADSAAKSSSLAEENKKLKKDIDDLKNNLNVLTAKGNKLIELEEQNKRIHKQLNDYEKQFVELNSQNEKLKQVEAENYQLKSSVTSKGGDNERYTQLETDNSRLKSDLENYHSIVAETENKLRQLEKSIDAEEKKWQEKLKQAQSHPKEQGDSGLPQRIKELELLVAQQDSQVQEYRRVLSLTTKTPVSSSSQEIQVSQGSQEMQTKVAELEDELREAHEMIIVITKEKETVITQLTETQIQVSSGDTKSLEKELVEIRTILESERKKNKDLSLNVVKLNGIIKTGQDALSQEQNVVKKLQESLDSKSVNSGATELEEVDQLRSKLSEKQKHLEREISTNKQLSERLAQLGVLEPRK
uniref:Nucleoprotein TPR n=1 Tax=Arion vulgaris TaxID=1028688 RepID=A0A0B7BJP4_9EUPU